MKILILATGGTIGSAFENGRVDVIAGNGCPAAQRYAAAHPDVQFDIVHPLNILSETLCAADLNTLAAALYRVGPACYDGVILTAGSDNLAYLAAFVGLLLDGRIPAAIVASDRVLSDPESNGYDNFSCAVELIRRGEPGAFVPYRNRDGEMFVHSATDLRQADMSDDFTSFHGAYAVYRDGVLQQRRGHISQQIPPVFDAAHLPVIRDNVLLVHPYPMQDYARLCTDGVSAVLHTLYHSGTLDSRSVIRWMERHREIPLFLASLRRGRPLYATTADVLGTGAIPLYDIAPECAYMKLLLACAQQKISVERFMRCLE